MRRLPARVAAGVRAHPRRVLTVLGAATLALAAAAPFTRWDSDPELIALEGSPELRVYREYLERFGSDELIIVAFERPDLLEPAGLAMVRSLTQALRDVPGVESVSSLDTAYRVDFGPFGPFASPLIPDELAEAPDAASLKASLRALPMTRDSLIDDSGTVTTLAIQPRARELGAEARSLQRDVLEGAMAVLERPEYRGTAFHLAGSPVFNRELERLNARDTALFTPVAFAVVSLMLAVALRQRVLVALSIGCVLATLAWVRGMMTLLDVPQSTTTSLLPPLLMVLAVSVAIHVLARYRLERSGGAEPGDAVLRTEQSVLLPASLTAATTALGFGSLASSPIPSIRTFGLFAAAGRARRPAARRPGSPRGAARPPAGRRPEPGRRPRRADPRLRDAPRHAALRSRDRGDRGALPRRGARAAAPAHLDRTTASSSPRITR